MNTTELISALKICGSFPTSNDLFSTADFLTLFNMQMQSDITPMMLKLNEEFFLQSKDFTISQGSTYRIPRRAIGAKVRDLTMVDNAGNVTPIIRLFEEDRPKALSGYYMLRNSIELSTDFTSNTLRMKIFGRPSTLVLTSACGQITSIDTGTNQVIVSSAPSTFATNTLVDFIQNNNPYDLLAMDVSISSVSGTTLTFSSLPDGLEVGDWIALATEAPVPMVPEEVHPVLIQSCLCRTLSSKKDKAYDQERVTLEKMVADAINMLDPRVANNSIKFRSGKLASYFSGRGRFR
jgi:hypothetical protein